MNSNQKFSYFILFYFTLYYFILYLTYILLHYIILHLIFIAIFWVINILLFMQTFYHEVVMFSVAFFRSLQNPLVCLKRKMKYWIKLLAIQKKIIKILNYKMTFCKCALWLYIESLKSIFRRYTPSHMHTPSSHFTKRLIFWLIFYVLFYK